MTESHDYSPNPFSGSCWPYPGKNATEARRIEQEHNANGDGMRGLYLLMLLQLEKDYGISRAEMLERFEAAVQKKRRFAELLQQQGPLGPK